MLDRMLDGVEIAAGVFHKMNVPQITGRPMSIEEIERWLEDSLEAGLIVRAKDENFYDITRAGMEKLFLGRGETAPEP